MINNSKSLDEMVPVNSGIIGQYISPVGPFSEPMYAMVDNDTVAAAPAPTRTRSSKVKKKKSNKPKNDGIIRNHDSVWDYKIQDGKLLTRRKSSDGKWYDITSNDEARSRIESFTGRSIGGSSNKQAANNKTTTSQSTQQSQVTQPSQPARQQSQPATRQVTSTQSTTTTAQPARQQTVARQDSTRRNTGSVQQPVQQRSSAQTSANNAEPDWQNMTDAEVAAYFSGSPLGGVTKTGKGNPNKKTQLLSDADLRANGWHWSNGQDFADAPTTDYNLLESARAKADNDNILLDSNGAVVPTSAVNRYINRGRVPLSISDYDLQFYQPQSENGTLRDVRRAQDIRRNRDFDRQRNIGLGAMVGAPVLVGSMATAPAATLLGLAGSELVGAGFGGTWQHATGRSWEESLAGRDATGQFYAGMLQPGRAIGGFLGGYAANATQPARQAVGNVITKGFNNIVGNGENPSLIGLLRRQAYVNRPTGFTLPARQPQAVVEQVTPKAPRTLKGTTGKGNSLSEAKARTKAYWEERQPYEVTVEQHKNGRLYPTFNTNKFNGSFKGYPINYRLPSDGLTRCYLPSGLLNHYINVYRVDPREAVQMLKQNFNIMYDLPYGYWQSTRPTPNYFTSPRSNGIYIGD